MLIARLLKSKGEAVYAIGPESTVADAAAMLAKHRIGSVLVCEGAGKGSEASSKPGIVLGILSERDIVRALADSGGSCLKQHVSDLMSSKVITCHPDDTVQSVMGLMTQHRIRHVPVMARGNEGGPAAGQGATLLGIVSIGDVVKHRLEEAEAEAQALNEYVRTG